MSKKIKKHEEVIILNNKPLPSNKIKEIEKFIKDAKYENLTTAQMEDKLFMEKDLVTQVHKRYDTIYVVI